jgi:hypothetical protein
MNATTLTGQPVFSPYRDDPRFIAAVKRLRAENKHARWR